MLISVLKKKRLETASQPFRFSKLQFGRPCKGEYNESRLMAPPFKNLSFPCFGSSDQSGVFFLLLLSTAKVEYLQCRYTRTGCNYGEGVFDKGGKECSLQPPHSS